MCKIHITITGYGKAIRASDRRVGYWVGSRVIAGTWQWHISSCLRKPQTDDSGTVVEKECLAIVWVVAKFHIYLYGRQFVLQTDHRPLTFVERAKMANVRVMRWALALQVFKFKRIHQKSDNVGADYLNRISRVATSTHCADEIWAALCQVPRHGVTRFGRGYMLRAAL